jgi:hypothetical protein
MPVTAEPAGDAGERARSFPWLLAEPSDGNCALSVAGASVTSIAVMPGAGHKGRHGALEM